MTLQPTLVLLVEGSLSASSAQSVRFRGALSEGLSSLGHSEMLLDLRLSALSQVLMVGFGISLLLVVQVFAPEQRCPDYIFGPSLAGWWRNIGGKESLRFFGRVAVANVGILHDGSNQQFSEGSKSGFRPTFLGYDFHR